MAPASLSASSLGRKQGPVTTSDSADSMSCPTRTTVSPFALLGTPQGHPRLCLLSLSVASPGLTPRSPSSRASRWPHAFARALVLALRWRGWTPAPHARGHRPVGELQSQPRKALCPATDSGGLKWQLPCPTPP